MKCLIYALPFLISGCFSNSDGGVKAAATISWMSFYAKSQSTLPSCTTDRQDQIWYTEDSKSFQRCDSYIWKKINYGTKPLEIIKCSTMVQFQNGNNYETATLRYEAIKYNTNEVRIFCRVNTEGRSDSNEETSSSGFASIDEYLCEAIGDLDFNHPPTGAYDKSGRWQFSKTDSTISYKYIDTGHPLNGHTWIFSTNECIRPQVAQ